MQTMHETICNKAEQYIELDAASPTTALHRMDQLCAERRDKDAHSPTRPGEVTGPIESFASCSLPQRQSAVDCNNRVTDAIGMHVVKDMVPIDTVEKPGFINMVKKPLDSRYKLPSRKYFSDITLPPLYRNVGETISTVGGGAVLFRHNGPVVHLGNRALFESGGSLYLRGRKLRAYKRLIFPENHTGELIA